ncbi:MAG: sugar O-acetyltransferase [Pseudoclavibacter sp.]
MSDGGGATDGRGDAGAGGDTAPAAANPDAASDAAFGLPRPASASDPTANAPTVQTQLERRSAGLPYVGNAEIGARAGRALALTQQYRDEMLRDYDAAQDVLRDLLGSLGERSHVVPPLFVDDGSNVFVGDRVFINANLTALDVVPIRIGDDAQLGPNVQLLAPTHPINPELRASGVEAGEPITIEAGVWLGGGVIVAPGVTIGAGSVVGAGAVVTRSIPPRSVAVGNPARVIRSVDDLPEREAEQWAGASDALALADRDDPDLTPRFGV